MGDRTKTLLVLFLIIGFIFTVQAAPIIYPGYTVVGTKWYSGSGVPSVSTGSDGDYYLDTTGGDIYTKSSGSWSYQIHVIGAAGTPGDAGAPGTPATISVNYTFTGAPGTSALVTNLGSPSAASFDFTIPQGIQGEPGEAGSADMSWNVSYPLLSGLRTLTGKWNFGGFNLSNIGEPVVSSDAASKNTVDAANTSMRNNVSMNFAQSADIVAANNSMRNNVSMNFVSISALAPYDLISNQSTVNASIRSAIVAANDSMRNNVSMNFAQSADIVAANTSMRNNISMNYPSTAYVDAANTSMRNNVSMNFAQSADIVAANTSMRNNVSMNHAGLVSGKVPTVQLGGAGADATTYLRGDQTWAIPAGGSADMTWNVTYPLLSGTRQITGKWDHGKYNVSNITSLLGGDAVNLTYVTSQNDSMRNNVSMNFAQSADIVAANTSMRNNVSMNFPSLTLLTAMNNSQTANTSLNFPALSLLIAMNTSMRNNVSMNFAQSADIVAANTSMRNNVSMNYPSTAYVDAVNTSMRNNVSKNHAGLVSGYVPTAQLGSGAASGSTYLRGDQTWASPAGGSDPTAYTTTLLSSDFYSADTTGTIPGLTGLAISSGTIAVVATTANHPGVIYMRDSTTANGGYKFGCVGTQLIGGGETFEVVFQPVGVRVGQIAVMGWSDTAAGMTAPVDGVYFNISANGAAISLKGNTSSNSARSGTLTSYAPSTATWYRGTIAVNAAGTLVTYTLYNEAGASLWTDTVATNIPTGAGRDTSPCIIVAQGTTNAAADILRLDYVKWGSTRTLTR